MNIFKKHRYLIYFLTLITLIILWVQLILKGEYGTTLFFSIPATIGFLIGYSRIYNSDEKRDRTLKKAIKSFCITLLIIAGLSGLLIEIGVEGAICILMAYPFLIIPVFSAFLIGNYVGKTDRKNKMNSLAIVVLFLLNPISYIFDSYTKPIEDVVITEYIIKKSPAEVWDSLTSEIIFKKKLGLLFAKGVSHPKQLIFNNTIKPNFICYTNNDTITLDILKMNSIKNIKFKLREQTIPMKEISPYNSINAKHLHNYFNVNYGEILLKPISKNKTKLIAITSYNYKIAPKWYWKLWSNYIINKMHLHVLKSL